MADNKPSGNLKSDPYGDPFSDLHPRFNVPSPYNSTTSLSIGQDSLHDPYAEDDVVEKQPLNVGQSFAGGFYPPA
jgi:chitin synthase